MLARLLKHSDLAAAFAVVVVVVMMVVPLPAALVDLVITMNISAALVILIVTMYVPRALYREVDLGQQIPEEFFQAVAEVLAFVYRTAGRRRAPLKSRTKRPITGPHALQQASP